MNKSDFYALAEKSRVAGFNCYSDDNFSQAFAHFLLALTIRNDWHEDLKEAFIHCLCEWGKTLEQETRYTDLFTCYEEALKIYPSSEVIQNNIGAHLLRLNHFKEASTYFRQALQLNSNYLPAYRNLENASNSVVERWHFRMLNDKNRNECYRRAIHSKIDQGYDTILDIGTGTGLLSLYASEKNPKFIFACDYSKIMTSIASDIAEKNKLSEKIKIINKLSNDLTVPNDIPVRLKLLVTETMDAGLLGEGLLGTLDDAWNRLLMKDKSNEYKRISRVIPEKAVMFLVPVQSSFLRRKFKHLYKNSESYLPSFEFDLFAELEDSYDTVDLKKVKYNFLSEPTILFKIDFNNPFEIKEYLSGNRNAELTIVCNTTGYLDAFIVWFDVHLNENEVISTSPLSEIDSCWDQAVFSVNKNIWVQNGTKIQLKMDTKDGKLNLKSYCVDVSNKDSINMYQVSKDFVRSINNQSSTEKLHQFCKEIIKTNLPISNILDLSVYPFVGLSMLKNSSRVVSFQKNEHNLNFLKYYTEKNNIDNKMYDFFPWNDIFDYLKQEPTFDLVIFELLDSRSEINEHWMTLYPQIRKTVKEGGMIFPDELRIHCQLVNSEWLENSSKFNNTTILHQYEGFTAINDYKINHFIDLDINKLSYTKMSSVLDIARIEVSKLFSNKLEEFTIPVEIANDGCINAILYWFSYGNNTIMISSNAEDFSGNQAAEMLKKSILVKRSEMYTVRLHLMSCILKFDLFKSNV